MKHFPQIRQVRQENEELRTTIEQLSLVVRIANEYPGRMVYDDFRQQAAAATQVATKMTRGHGTLSAQNDVIVTKPSAIHSLSLYTDTAVTAGSATLLVYKNGVALTPGLVMTANKFATVVFSRSLYLAVAGDLISVWLSTSTVTAGSRNFRGVLELISQGVS